MAAPALVIQVAANLAAIRASLEGDLGQTLITTQKQLQTTSSAFDGSKIISQAGAAVQAVQNLGGVSTLTAAEQTKLNATLNEAIDKYTALGKTAPSALVEMEQQTRQAENATSDLGNALTNAFEHPIAALQSLGQSILDGAVNPMITATVAAGATVGAIALLADGAIKLAEHAADDGEKIGDLALKMNDSVKSASVLQAGFQAAGVGMDQVGQASFNLDKRLEANFKQVSDGLKQLGLDVTQFASLNPADRMLELSDAFRNLPPWVDKAAIAFELFGKSGADQLIALQKPLSDLVNQSRELGLEWTDHEVAAAEQFKEQSTLLGEAVDRLKDRIGEEFLPVLTSVVELFSKSDVFVDFALGLDLLSASFHALAGEQQVLTAIPIQLWFTEQKASAESLLSVVALMPGDMGKVASSVLEFGTAWDKAKASMVAAQQAQADQQRALDVWYAQTQAETKALAKQLEAQDKATAAQNKLDEEWAKSAEAYNNQVAADNDKLATFLQKIWHDYYDEKTRDAKQAATYENDDLQLIVDANKKAQEAITASTETQFEKRAASADAWMASEIGKVKIGSADEQNAILAIVAAHQTMVDQISTDQDAWIQQQRDNAKQVVGIWESAFESLPQILMNAFEGGGNLEGAIKSFATKLATTLSSSLANSEAYGSFVNGLGNLFGEGFAAFMKSAAGRDLVGGLLTGLASSGLTRIAQSGQNGAGSGLIGAGELAGSVGISTGLMTGSAATAAVAGAATFGIGAAVVAGIAAYEAHKNDTLAARQDFATQLGYKDLSSLYTDLQSKGTEGQALANTGLNVIGKHDTAANTAWMKQVTDFLTSLQQGLATVTTEWQNFDQTASSLGVTLPADLDSVVAKLEKIGTSDDLDALKTGFGKAQDALSAYQAEVDKTNAFKTVEQEMQNVGLTADDMNGKFKQMKDEETARTLAQEWKDLAPYVGDVNVLAAKFGDQIEGMVKDSLDAGVAIPESMKPIIQSLMDQGKLVDDNGDKITDMSKLTFEQDPLQQAFDALNKTLEDLDGWLKNKLPKDLSDLGDTTVSPTVDVGIKYHADNSPPDLNVSGGVTDGQDTVHMASGGYVPPQPGGTRALLAEGGEGEYVIPASKMGAAAAALSPGGDTHIYLQIGDKLLDPIIIKSVNTGLAQRRIQVPAGVVVQRVAAG